jgi:hypothetical protein
MMGGGAFFLLKTGSRRPESAKQAEIHLAILLKIVQIAGFWAENHSQKVEPTCIGCTAPTSADMANPAGTSRFVI